MIPVNFFIVLCVVVYWLWLVSYSEVMKLLALANIPQKAHYIQYVSC